MLSTNHCRQLARAALVAAICLVPPFRATAHDIPNDVMVHAYIKPAGQRLYVLVRAPLKAIRDIEFPKRGPGYLDLARADSALRDAATLRIANAIDLYEGDVKLPKARVAEVRVSLESDKAFASYDDALGHLTGARLPSDTEIYWEQAMLDTLLEYPIVSDQSRFSLRSELGRLGAHVVTVLRFLPPSGAVRSFELLDDTDLVRLDPGWLQAAGQFVKFGFFHILEGIDHLLFLFCLVIPFRRFRALIPIVTSFTAAHSVTLIASAYNLGPDYLWFPPLIETLIAMSIVYMALENIAGASSVQRRWIITFGFGLVHGFGFSFALRRMMQFAGAHLLTSLLSFNIGVELGQLLVLALVIPMLQLLFRFVVAERVGTIILSALVAHTGWHWMIERGEQLSRFRLQWPALDAALSAGGMRTLLVIAILAGVIWLGAEALRQRTTRKTVRKATQTNFGG